MAARKGGLGRGLDALIPVDRPELGFTSIPLDLITPNPQQPRQRFDAESLSGLAASIREVGVLQPVVVRPADTEGSYVLVAGERRCRAARLAGLSDVPAVIRGDDTDDTTNLTEALVENVQREDLTPLEEAAAYRQLLEDFGLTHAMIADRVGRSRSAVTNTLRLLQLPAPIQGMLERGDITAGHARPLLSVEDETYAIHIAERVAEEGWSVRQVEEASRARHPEPAPPSAPSARPVRPAPIIELEDRLSEHLGTRVNINYGGKGGKLVIGFTSLTDLERIYRLFYEA